MEKTRTQKIGLTFIILFCALLIFSILAYFACVRTVTFVDWDGTPLARQRVLYNDAASSPEAPSRTGYAFLGWDTDIDHILVDTTITAEYEKQAYRVTFLDWDDNILDTQSVLYEEDAHAPTPPKRLGYAFIGWDKPFAGITEDTDIHTKYVQLHYKNELGQIEHGAAEVSEAEPTYGEEVTIALRPAAGYTFGSIKVTAADRTSIDITKGEGGTYTFVQPAQKVSINIQFLKIMEQKDATCAYCGAQGHAARYCAAKAIANGAVGRWVIPDIGINVACYASSAQSVCDRKDSACYFSLGAQYAIADHWNQGFDAIKKCAVGTKAYMETGDEKQWYACTQYRVHPH